MDKDTIELEKHKLKELREERNDELVVNNAKVLINKCLRKVLVHSLLVSGVIIAISMVIFNLAFLLQADTSLNVEANGIRLGMIGSENYFDYMVLANSNMATLGVNSFLLFTLLGTLVVIIGFLSCGIADDNNTRNTVMRTINHNGIEHQIGHEIKVKHKLNIYKFISIPFVMTYILYLLTCSSVYKGLVEKAVENKPIVFGNMYKNITVKSVGKDGKVVEHIKVLKSGIISLNDKVTKEGETLDTSKLLVLDKTLDFGYSDDNYSYYEVGK